MSHDHVWTLLDGVAAVRALTAAVAVSPWVGFDLEFASSDRYWPELCLLQIAIADHKNFDATLQPFVARGEISRKSGAGKAEQQAIFLVETKPLALPLGHGATVTDERAALIDLMAMLFRHRCLVAHAPRQDLAIIIANAGVDCSGIFDTQTAAAFCGIGDQVGYARLVDEVMGVALSKEHQWTDWKRRPLSPAQLGYAADDVRYLYPLYGELQRRLGQRSTWSSQESAAIIVAARNAVRLDPEQSWRDVAGIRGLTPLAARIVMATAQWRLVTARTSNRPLSHIVDDNSLLEFAKQCAQWRGHGNIDEVVTQHMNVAKIPPAHRDSLMTAMAKAIADKDRVIPPELLRPDTGPNDPANARQYRNQASNGRAAKWAEQLMTIAAVTADETGIAVRLLATRSDAESFARRADDNEDLASHPVLATWRRQPLGQRWLSWLAGRGAIVVGTVSPLGLAWREIEASKSIATKPPAKPKVNIAKPVVKPRAAKLGAKPSAKKKTTR
jgi:ribonuclease D